MKSRISIEVDFENGNQPIIEIKRQISDDVRDNLISSFLQNLGGISNWCRIEFVGEHSNRDFSRWKIIPIQPADLAKESKLIAENAKLHSDSLKSNK